jgi:UDP-glucose 4-epimerase
MATLVTGAGIIGCHVARQLVERGERPVLYDLRPEPAAIEAVVPPGAFDLVQGDIRDAAALGDAVGRYGATAVVHTAALLTTACRARPSQAVDVNVGGALNVLELARSGAVRRVVLASSTSVTYAAFDAYPLSPIPEDYAFRAVSQAPASFYSATKLSVEFLAGLYRREFGVDVVVLRYGAVLGAWSGENTGLVPRLLSQLFEAARAGCEAVIRDPAFTWDGIEEFIDARDCASGTLAALDRGAGAQHVYTVSSDQGWTLEQFTDAVQQVCPGLRIRHEVRASGGFAGFPLVRRSTSDLGAAARDLQWRPRYTLPDSLRHIAQAQARGGRPLGRPSV